MAPVNFTTEALLREIGAESGSQLLRSCKEILNPLGNSFIPSLDGILEDDELDLLAAFSTTEIQGPPKSGKTSLLLFIVMTTLLPSSILLPFTRPASVHRSDSGVETRMASVSLGGRGPNRAVLYFDADGRFPLSKLARMLHLHLAKRVRASLESYRSTGGMKGLPQLVGSGTQPWDAPSSQSIDAAVLTCLRGLLIWRPASETQLAASVRLAKRELHVRLPDFDAALVVVDSISAFHWQEIRRAEILGIQPGQQQAGAPASLHAPQSHTLKALARLQSDTGAAMIVTTWVFGHEQATGRRTTEEHDDARPVLYKPALPWPYHAPFLEHPRPAAPPLHLRLSRHISLVPMSANPGQFPSYMTLETALEAEAPGAARSVERERGHIVAWLRECCDILGNALKPEMASHPRGPIRYRVKEDAIEVM